MPLWSRSSDEPRDSTAVLAVPLLALAFAGCGSPASDDAGWVRVELEQDTAVITDANRLHLKVRAGTTVLFATTAGIAAPITLDAAELPGPQRTFEVVFLTATNTVTALGDAGPVDLPADRHTTVVIPLREP